MDESEQQLLYFLSWVSTSKGLLAVGVCLIALLLAALVPTARWAFLTLLLYCGTLGSNASEAWFDNTLSTPLEQIRIVSRPLCAFLLLALLVISILQREGWRLRLLSSPAVLYYFFQLGICIRCLFSGLLSRGFFGAVVFTITALTFGPGLSRWIQTTADAYKLIRCIAIGAVLLVIATSYQLAVNASAIVLNNRLYAITNNPNTLGYISAISIPAMFVLFKMPDRRLFWRLFLVVAIAANSVFLFWSGSRAGLLTALVATLVVARRGVKPLVLMVLVLGIVTILAAQFTSTEFSAIFRTDDTRSAAWQSMLSQFSQAPLFGSPGEKFGIQESLYLAVAGNFGVVGLLLLISTFAAVALKLHLNSDQQAVLGDLAPLYDFCLSISVSLSIGSIFDAHLLGTFVYSVYSLYISFAILMFVRDVCDVRLQSAMCRVSGEAAFADDGHGYPSNVEMT